MSQSPLPNGVDGVFSCGSQHQFPINSASEATVDGWVDYVGLLFVNPGSTVTVSYVSSDPDYDGSYSLKIFPGSTPIPIDFLNVEASNRPGFLPADATEFIDTDFAVQVAATVSSGYYLVLVQTLSDANFFRIQITCA